jgi:signal transduction histidine kinase
MMTPSTDTPSSWLTDARAWRWVCAALLLATVAWLMGSWVATRGWLSLRYDIDMPATFLCALVLLLLGLGAGWQCWQLTGGQTQATHKQWLSVLLVRREQAEQAAQAIESLGDALESLQQAWQPLTEQLGHVTAAETSRLDLISPDLEPVLSVQSEMSGQLQSLQARLVNLQVKFGRGDPLDALAYELTPLSHEVRDLESRLGQLFEQLQAIERTRVDHLSLYRDHQASQDPYGPWRLLLESALTQVEEARNLLAHSLDQAPPHRSPHIDRYLGLRP